MFEPINYLATFVAAIAHYVVGALWYGVVFKKKWLALMNPDEEMLAKMEAASAKSMAFAIFGSLFVAYVTARIIVALNPESIVVALLYSVLVWLGYALTVHLNDSLYEMKPWGLFILNSLYSLAGILVATTIIFYWK